MNIVAIGYGSRVDERALRRFTEATNGKAFVTADWRKAREIFLEASATRVCFPKCPGA